MIEEDEDYDDDIEPNYLSVPLQATHEVPAVAQYCHAMGQCVGQNESEAWKGRKLSTAGTSQVGTQTCDTGDTQ